MVSQSTYPGTYIVFCCCFHRPDEKVLWDELEEPEVNLDDFDQIFSRNEPTKKKKEEKKEEKPKTKQVSTSSS